MRRRGHFIASLGALAGSTEVERFITNLHRTPPDVVAAARTISGD
jgi:hypothetical protein